MQLMLKLLKIFAGCGQPDYGNGSNAIPSAPAGKRAHRMKRKSGKGKHSDDADDDDELHYFEANPAPPPSPRNSTLQRLADALKQQLEASHGFWIRLPYQICGDQRLAAADLGGGGGGRDSCWNGLSNGRYFY